MKVRPNTFQCLLDLLENRGGTLRINNHSLHVVSIQGNSIKFEDDYEIRGQSDLLMWREYNDWHIKV